MLILIKKINVKCFDDFWYINWLFDEWYLYYISVINYGEINVGFIK